MPRRPLSHRAGGHRHRAPPDGTPEAGDSNATRAISRRGEEAAEPIERIGLSKRDERDLPRFAPGLYLVATPIGNLRDITLRALDLLGAADLVACEDTRVTATLMARYGLTAPRLAYHEHNAERMRPLLIERLRSGAVVALVTDAGTPLISDPGFKLVREAVEAGIAVTALPGPSAVLDALVLAALPSDRFFFQGFLPSKDAARRRVLAELAAIPASLVIYETAPRLAASLADMADVLGDRPAAIARELTKLYEEIRRGSLGALAAEIAASGPPKGEIVIVIAPRSDAAPAVDEAGLDTALRSALATMSVKDASAAVAASTGLPRRAVYQRAVALAADEDREDEG